MHQLFSSTIYSGKHRKSSRFFSCTTKWSLILIIKRKKHNNIQSVYCKNLMNTVKLHLLKKGLIALEIWWKVNKKIPSICEETIENKHLSLLSCSIFVNPCNTLLPCKHKLLLLIYYLPSAIITKYKCRKKNTSRSSICFSPKRRGEKI